MDVVKCSKLGASSPAGQGWPPGWPKPSGAFLCAGKSPFLMFFCFCGWRITVVSPELLQEGSGDGQPLL